jgi:hypothetical protein
VDRTLISLKDFRAKYPFTENLRSIEWLDPDKLFKVSPDEVGEFFRLLEGCFKPLNLSPGSPNVYRNARLQIKDFKNLLRIAVDSRKSLSEKIDAKWERIGGIDQDKQLAKKIIFCFNYESGNVLPILSNQHIRHFVSRVADSPSGQTKYLSSGQEYEHYTAELLKIKNGFPLTRGWNSLYFARFLYDSFPPPDTMHPNEEKKTSAVTDEQLDMQGFVALLGELQKKGKVTGEQFREYRELWMQQPSERQTLKDRLKSLRNK